MKYFTNIKKSKRISRIQYLTVSPLHHVVLSHQHLYVDFCNSLLTTLPACALVKPSQIASLLCSKPSNGWLLFPLKIKASHKNYNRESPPRVFMTSLNLSTMFPFILSAPAAPASSVFLENTWQVLTSRPVQHYLSPLVQLIA